MKAKIKKLMPFILAFSIVLCSMVLCTALLGGGVLTPLVSAADSDAFSYQDKGDGTCYIIGFDKSQTIDKTGELIIPSEYEGLTVVGIKREAFINCTELTSVVIPDTVKEIGIKAFYGCQKLANIDLSADIITIGSQAFEGTAFYNNSENWENGVLYIENILLAVDSSYSGEVVIKDGTTCIVTYAFSNAKKITKLTIPGSLSVIGKGIFADCKSVKEVVILEGVTEICEQAFSYCTALEKITLPISLERVYYNAFTGCSKITEPHYNGTIDQWVNIDFDNYGDNPVSIAKTLYINGEKITKAVITAPIVKNYAFYKCNTLEEVVLTDSVTEVGDSAFSDNYNLKEVTVGSGVEAFYRKAFYNCNKIEKVNTTKTPNEWSQISFVERTSNPATMAKDLYINDVLFEEAEFKNVTEIKKNTFNSFKSLKAITIPETVVEIGENAFYNTAIVHLNIPEGTETIGSYAFCNCAALKTVDLPGTLKEIGASAFAWTGNMTYANFRGSMTQWVSIDFGDAKANPTFQIKKLYINDILVKDAVIEGVKEISEYAFYNCESLETVYIVGGVERIGRYAFSGCTNLKSVDIPNTLDTFYDRAFEMCTGLEKVNYRGAIDEWAVKDFRSEWANPIRYSHCLYLNDVLVEKANIRMAPEIHDNTFINCDSIKTLIVGGNVTKIGHSFSGCKELVSLEIKKSVTAIDIYAFKECSNLVDVNINEEGEKLSLSSYAFLRCSSLEEIRLPKKVTRIGNGTFQECTSLRMVYMSKDLTQICSDAFRQCPSLEVVYYESDMESFASIAVEVGNEAFTNAEIHYNVNDIDSHYTIVTVPATCTKEGSISKTCPCGYSSFTILHVSDHKHVVVNKKSPTCTEKGYTGDEICEFCNQVYKTGMPIKALGHKGGTATCSAPALCERCSEYYGEALPHTFLNDDTVCSVCGYGGSPDDEEKPNDETPAPDEDAEKPSGETQTPNVDADKPNDETPTPNEDTDKPNGETQTPNEDAEKPNGETQTPNVDAEKPNGETQTPNEDEEKPNGETQAPNEDAEKPNGDTQAPNEDAEKPNSNAQTPNNEQEQTTNGNDQATDNNGQEKDRDDKTPDKEKSYLVIVSGAVFASGVAFLGVYITKKKVKK